MRYTLDRDNTKDGLFNVLDNGTPTKAYAVEGVTFSGDCEVRGGTFRGGVFYGGWFYGGWFDGGVFKGGTFESGRFEGGTFWGGTFKYGRFEGGVFEGGWFYDGWFRGGTFDETTNPSETEEGDNMKADRKNAGKAPLSMVLEAHEAMAGAAQVLAFGAKKYARGNWHRGLNHTEIVDCLARHLGAYLSGEDLDPESGLPHVDHVLCNAIFLAQMVRTHPELDNRSEELKK